MNEIGYQETYDKLIAILKNNGLEWVADQVAEHIRMGKTIQREIETLKEDRGRSQYISSDYQYQFRKGPRDTFPVLISYEPRERLELLINAIEVVVIDTAQIESEINTDFQSKWENYLGIQFYPDESVGEPMSLTIDKSKSRLENSSRLKELLEMLRMRLE